MNSARFFEFSLIGEFFRHVTSTIAEQAMVTDWGLNVAETKLRTQVTKCDKPIATGRSLRSVVEQLPSDVMSIASSDGVAIAHK